MGKKNIAQRYGLENDLEVSLKEETKDNDIVNKETVQKAIQDGIAAARERTPEENEKMKQLVTVLENIRASLENIDQESNVDDTITLTKTAVNALLTNNDLEPLDECETINVTKENISKRINSIKQMIH